MFTASTATVHGHYDFFTGIITLDKFRDADLPTVTSALAVTPPPVIDASTIQAREIRALVKHELTHFLDQVSTLWGLEFLVRRGRLIRAIKDGGDVTQPLQVYLLNVAELQMHSDLVRTYKAWPLAQCDTVRHLLIYEQRHGAIVIVKFFRESELIHDVPLSMLSLLEANAIANEYLSRLDDLTGMDVESRRIAEAVVERKLDKVLSDTALSEYSVIITLAKRHFDYLDTAQLLRFVCVLVNFSLNATLRELGTIAEVIRPSCANSRVGIAIWADLCRGMSRHVIAFKTILFMHGWIASSSDDTKLRLVDIMKTDPERCIEEFWNAVGMKDPLGADFEKKAALSAIKKYGTPSEFAIASESLKKNKNWRAHKNLGACHFDEIACLDILLGDDTVVQMPGRIDFDVLEHSNAIVDAYCEAEKRAGDEIRKFHMPPEQAFAMLAAVLERKQGM